MNLRDTMLQGFYCYKQIVFLFFFISIFNTLYAQSVVFVDSGSPCVSGCGGSWANAYPDLREALIATDSGQVWVAKGTYRPTTCAGTCQNLDRLESFRLKSKVAIYGGFFGNETMLDQRDPVVNATILSGDIGFEGSQSDNSFHVVLATNVDSTAILDGFIIRDGLANGTFGTNNGNGGALFINAISMGTCSPVIRNCLFTANESSEGGGAIYVNNEEGGTVKPLLEDCSFLENRVEGNGDGGAITHNVTVGGLLAPIYRRCTFDGNESSGNAGAIAFLASNLGSISAPKIIDCTFLENNAVNSGGAIYASANDNAVHQAVIQNTTFSRNEVDESGGALYDEAIFGAVTTTRILNCYFKENFCVVNGGALYLKGIQTARNLALLFNCIFDSNKSTKVGGAIYTTSSLNGTNLGVCRPRITNCTFYNNSADETGNALFNHYSNTILNNSILWDDELEIGNKNSNPTIEDCIIKGGYVGLGSISNVFEDNPFFLNPQQGNFRLSFCSPAIDVGQIANIPIDSTDLDSDTSTSEQIDIDMDGIERTFGPSVDLGAFEWSGSPEEGEVIFVKWDASGANDGSSWDDAYTDLQSALSAAYPCANIWVARGEYKPIDCVGGCTPEEQRISFMMKNQVAIYGGFSGVESALEERDFVANETILSGNLGDLTDSSDNAFHVVYADQIDSTGILDGFTILDGNASGGNNSNEIFGGGLYVDGAGGRANPSIRNCTFRNNQAKGSGGAVYHNAGNGGILNPIFENCAFLGNSTTGFSSGGAISHLVNNGGRLNPIYRNCTFIGNNALENGGAVAHFSIGDNTISQPEYYGCQFETNLASNQGGAIYAVAISNAEHQLIIQNCTFVKNETQTIGGAIYDGVLSNSISTSRIINSVFQNNQAEIDGGAVYLQGGESGTNRTIIFNALFFENTAEQKGGAVFNSGISGDANTGNCEPFISNCTFSDNIALNGTAIYNDFSIPEINNNILWDGGNEIGDNQSTPIVQNCLIQGGYQGDGFVLNIIEENPRFLDVINSDFRLASCSPAIDQGLTGIIPFDFSDVDGDNNNSEQIDIDLMESLRLFGGQVDLGAFEWNGFPTALSLEIVKDDVSCFGSCDGEVVINPDGGSGNFMIEWSDGQDVSETNDLCPGNYEITVSDASLCTIVDSFEIIENEVLDLIVTPDTTVCEGSTASLTAVGMGGAGGYTYLWSENLGETSSVSFSPTEDQQIIVIVTDDNGCIKIDSIEIALEENPVVAISGPTSVCPGDSIQIQTDEYQAYLWSSGQETAVINVSQGGSYEVTVTDENGCMGTAMTEVADLIAPEPIIEGDTAFCFGGSAVLDAGEFESYDWSTGSNEPVITVIEANTYSVVVTNADGCEGTAMINVVENALPVVEITGASSFCEGDSTQLESGVFAGYSWSTGDSTATISTMVAGNFQLTVTDENGCQGEDAIEISVNESPQVDILGEADFCEGDSTELDAGLFETYEWSTGAMTATISVNSPDSYGVTVTNENGCTGSSSIEVIENPTPIVEIEGAAGICIGDFTMLEVGPYSGYLWSTGAVTPIIHVMSADEYSITVTDENGCMGNDQIEVEVFAEPMVEIMGDAVFCEGDSTILEASNFASYTWTGGSTDPTLVVLEGGNYGVTVTDNNGCEAEANLEIIENVAPVVEISGDSSYCAGESTLLDAGLFVSYLWSTMEESQAIEVDEIGIYDVEVTDENGCIGTGSIEISELALPEPEIEGLLSFCSGVATTLTTGDFVTYEWSNGGMTSEISVMEAGTYSVTVEDENGCFGNSSVKVMEAEDIQIEITGQLTFCNGDSTLLDAGDFESYEWSTGEVTPTIMVDMSGAYSVTVTDASGCSGMNSVEVEENAQIDLSIEGQTSICEGNTATLTADLGFVTYEWSTEDNASSIEITSAGTYSVTVTDSNGCTGSAMLEVDTAPMLMPTITGNLNICEGEPTILETGAFETYLWSSGAVTSSIETTTGGLYSVTVTDENGCNGVAEVMVNAITQTQAAILGASDGICIGESVELMASGNGEFTWIDNNGSLNIISPDVAIASPTQAATYGLVVTNTCFTDTTFLDLQIFDPPVIDVGSDLIIKKGEEVRLEASGANNFEWSGGNFLSCVSCASPLASPDSTFTFVAVGIDANGCRGVDSLKVTVLTEDVKLVDAVNAFTPNNDGVNDFFVIKEIEQFNDHKLTIFNRWGDTVYESLDYHNDWDGTFNGELLPAGTYLYVLVINALGEKQVIKSTITIVRE